MKLESRVGEVLKVVGGASKKALLAAAVAGRNQVVKNLSGSRSGIRYKVPGTQTYYTASSPGEYPAVATGALRESVKWQEVGDDVHVGTPLEYGLHLEKKPSSAGGREWLRPSLEQARPDMLKELAKEWL